MAVFDPRSRYTKSASTYECIDRRGRRVVALTIAERPVLALLGEHVRRQGQRLDHLAHFYFGDPHGYWRIAELSMVLLPDALAEAEILAIPTEL
jgi:hypothetical protein